MGVSGPGADWDRGGFLEKGGEGNEGQKLPNIDFKSLQRKMLSWKVHGQGKYLNKYKDHNDQDPHKALARVGGWGGRQI